MGLFKVASSVHGSGMTRSVMTERALAILHGCAPLLLIFYFMVASGLMVCITKKQPQFSKAAVRKMRIASIGLSFLIICTYTAQFILVISEAFKSKIPATQHEVVYLVASIFFWGLMEFSLLEAKYRTWHPYYGSWILAFIFEAVIFGLVCEEYYYISRQRICIVPHLVLAVSRMVLIMLLTFFYCYIQCSQQQPIGEESDEEQSLLNNPGQKDNKLKPYGAYVDVCHQRDKKAQEKVDRKLEQSGNIWNYVNSFALLWPLLWPTKNRALQFVLSLVGFLLLVERGLVILVPRQLGIITDTLASGSGVIPWVEVGLYVLFTFLNSGSGISALREYLWIPIDQNAQKAVTTTAFNHIMSLSYNFHVDKASGEIYQAVSTGRTINWFLESMFLTFIPMLVDLVIAFVYFYILFDAYMGLIVGGVMITYLWISARLVRYKTETRRDALALGRQETTIMWEALNNWQTVTYFNRIEYEQNRYLDIIKKYQVAWKEFILGMTMIRAAQAVVVSVGLLGACFLAVYQISRGEAPVGSLITFLAYWAQLAGPLTYLGSFMRQLQMAMIDAERLLELFDAKPAVQDKPDAKELVVTEGAVAFNNIKFCYDERKTTIDGVDFTAPAGGITAFVGETGAGKTTLMKLLFRFYDISDGSITIDGQDVKDVTLTSLRSNIGVVPQDPSLFNDTIMNNLRYANFEASDAEIYAACRLAAIHNKIESFPDGYDSRVGERGVKLSGGELQRVAIARAIIKNPKIVLLDEATSMVDLETEREIQEAFKQLAKNRTTFVVAHRLSTIINADLIVVINDGKVAEMGRHDDLLALKGKYSRLWAQHIKKDGPAPGDAPLMNDLSPGSKKKALHNQNKVAEQLQTNENQKAKVTTDTSDRRPRRSSSNASTHIPVLKRNLSNLKPDAPEYVPAAQRTGRDEHPEFSKVSALVTDHERPHELEDDQPEMAPGAVGNAANDHSQISNPKHHSNRNPKSRKSSKGTEGTDHGEQPEIKPNQIGNKSEHRHHQHRRRDERNDQQASTISSHVDDTADGPMNMRKPNPSLEPNSTEASMKATTDFYAMQPSQSNTSLQTTASAATLPSAAAEAKQRRHYFKAKFQHRPYRSNSSKAEDKEFTVNEPQTEGDQAGTPSKRDV